ncbi:hypothetical protein RJ640_003286 [Escallonia rubra]|uniref:Pentatricopeptide repeat-containing protein n=1 Tax=Escallonia rubra TaxID=112253 RepID=A0AA88QAN0_9ASTE|nr:hypothetical protein RJ640_003286 [Escallonia rubra]
MDTRSAPCTVIDPKVHQVGFFAPPDRAQPNPSTSSFSLPVFNSPSGNSLSPVMTPPLPLSPLRHPLSGESIPVGSYNLSEFAYPISSLKDFDGSIWSPGWGHRGAFGKHASSLPSGGFDLSAVKPNSFPASSLTTVSMVNMPGKSTLNSSKPAAYATLSPPLSSSALYHRNLRYARHIFDQMDPPNFFSWNTIIRALSESDDQNDDDPFQALVLFRLMLVDELVEPNRFTFPSVLKACAQTSRVEEGKQVHGMVVKIGLEDDEFVMSNLVRMYVMCGAMEYAHVLFNLNKVNMERKTQMGGTVLWNVMVDGFVRNGDFRMTRELFDEMPQRSVVSWNSMISGYAQNGLFKEAIKLFRDMQMGDTRPNYVIVGALDKLLQLFESLSQKNVITWNAILGGLAMHGRGKDAVDFFSKMQQA